ncbi:MAG: sulfatase-like hydrolase/transferase, partial [Planctomycetota bacterium]
MNQPPNFLLLYVDQMRYDAMGCAGHPDVVTPNLDRLASEGTRFARHFVQHPLCMPSRISMLTGRYPTNLRITEMGVPVPEDTATLATLLGRAGYRTANVGKLHFLPHSNRDHREPHPAYDFDHLEISDEPGPYDDAYRAYIRRTRPDQLDAISRHVLPPAAGVWREAVAFEDTVDHDGVPDPWTTVPFAGDDDATHTAFVGQRTIDLLNGAGDRPFFTIAGFYSPHSPLFAPQRFLDLYDPDRLTLNAMPDDVRANADEAGFSDATRRQAAHGYYAMISEVDHWVGRILDTLDERGLAENTVVAFTSDHGEFLGDFLRWAKGYPGPDCISRVPLLVRGPGVDKGVCEGLVEAVDIAPTFLELAGVPVPPHADGASLVPALSGQPFRGKPGVLMESSQFPGHWRTWRTPTHRYVLHDNGREHLYDLTAEHGEYHDVVDDPVHRDALYEHRHGLATKMIDAYHATPRGWPTWARPSIWSRSHGPGNAASWPTP